MPTVKLGDFVHYFVHEGSGPELGIVQKVSEKCLNLWVLSPGYGGVERPSVHHTDDPRLAEFPEWKSFGTWDCRPDDPRIAILQERVALLEKKVAAAEPRKARSGQ